ncbi:MAG: hypothetical protein ABEJ08_03025 [Halobacteriaceae archaeon]
MQTGGSETGGQYTYVEWWYVHAAATVSWVALGMAGAFMVLVPRLATSLVVAFVMLPFASAIGLAVPAFYWDARELRRQGSAWRPRWRRYVVASLLLTPLVTSPVYLYQRHRHAGRP